MPSARTFLVRGLLAGLIAGVVAFAVAYVVGEPSLNAAIAIEQAGETAAVPRSLQSTAGLLTATAVAGTTLGGLIGVLSALALGRFGGLGVRASTLTVTVIGFVAFYAVPFVVYPPNPPAVGRAETIGYRTGLYFVAVAISLIAAIAAVLGARWLAPRWGGWYAGLTGLAAYVLVIGVALGLLPRYDEVPADFPAAVLYDFRVASFVTQLSLWTVLGVLLAELAARAVPRTSPAPAPLVEAGT